MGLIEKSEDEVGPGGLGTRERERRARRRHRSLCEIALATALGCVLAAHKVLLLREGNLPPISSLLIHDLRELRTRHSAEEHDRNTQHSVTSPTGNNNKLVVASICGVNPVNVRNQFVSFILLCLSAHLQMTIHSVHLSSLTSTENLAAATAASRLFVAARLAARHTPPVPRPACRHEGNGFKITSGELQGAYTLVFEIIKLITEAVLSQSGAENELPLNVAETPFNHLSYASSLAPTPRSSLPASLPLLTSPSDIRRLIPLTNSVVLLTLNLKLAAVSSSSFYGTAVPSFAALPLNIHSHQVAARNSLDLLDSGSLSLSRRRSDIDAGSKNRFIADTFLDWAELTLAAITASVGHTSSNSNYNANANDPTNSYASDRAFDRTHVPASDRGLTGGSGSGSVSGSGGGLRQSDASLFAAGPEILSLAIYNLERSPAGASAPSWRRAASLCERLLKISKFLRDSETALLGAQLRLFHCVCKLGRRMEPRAFVDRIANLALTALDFNSFFLPSLDLDESLPASVISIANSGGGHAAVTQQITKAMVTEHLLTSLTELIFFRGVSIPSATSDLMKLSTIFGAVESTKGGRKLVGAHFGAHGVGAEQKGTGPNGGGGGSGGVVVGGLGSLTSVAAVRSMERNISMGVSEMLNFALESDTKDERFFVLLFSLIVRLALLYTTVLANNNTALTNGLSQEEDGREGRDGRDGRWGSIYGMDNGMNGGAGGVASRKPGTDMWAGDEPNVYQMNPANSNSVGNNLESEGDVLSEKALRLLSGTACLQVSLSDETTGPHSLAGDTGVFNRTDSISLGGNALGGNHKGANSISEYNGWTRIAQTRALCLFERGAWALRNDFVEALKAKALLALARALTQQVPRDVVMQQNWSLKVLDALLQILTSFMPFLTNLVASSTSPRSDPYAKDSLAITHAHSPLNPLRHTDSHTRTTSHTRTISHTRTTSHIPSSSHTPMSRPSREGGGLGENVGRGENARERRDMKDKSETLICTAVAISLLLQQLTPTLSLLTITFELKSTLRETAIQTLNLVDALTEALAAPAENVTTARDERDCLIRLAETLVDLLSNSALLTA